MPGALARRTLKAPAPTWWRGQRSYNFRMAGEGAPTPMGPGWWIASDGRWYPPHLHPSALVTAPAGGSTEPAPPPLLGGVSTAATGASPSGTVGAGELPPLFGGVTVPPADTRRTWVPPASPPPGSGYLRPGVPVADAGPSSGEIAAGTRRARHRRARKIAYRSVAVGLVVAAVAFGVDWYVTNHSVNRSPEAVAADFVVNYYGRHTLGLISDIEPSQVLTINYIPLSGFADSVLGDTQHGITATVEVVVCFPGAPSQPCDTAGDGLDESIPVIDIHGSWYVDVNQLPSCQGVGGEVACLPADNDGGAVVPTP